MKGCTLFSVTIDLGAVSFIGTTCTKIKFIFCFPKVSSNVIMVLPLRGHKSFFIFFNDSIFFHIGILLTED